MADKSPKKRLNLAQKTRENIRGWLENARQRRQNTKDKKKRDRRAGIVNNLEKRLDQVKKRIRALIHKIKTQKPTLGNLKISLSNRGGAGSLLDGFIEPFMQRLGLPLGSGLRTPAQNAAVGGSPTSDHLTTKANTDARDFPTFSGEDEARALARALGITSWQPNSYTSHYITVGGYRFRVQILWGGAIAHGDHVHVGVQRV